jgi:hypothetical protein
VPWPASASTTLSLGSNSGARCAAAGNPIFDDLGKAIVVLEAFRRC